MPEASEPSPALPMDDHADEADPDPDDSIELEMRPVRRPSVHSLEALEDTSSEPTDFTPYIEQLAPSTRKILQDDFQANFIYLIRPRSKSSAKPETPNADVVPTPTT
ncbi:MAG: hypothetical protein ABQ298_10680 [Puniceicoccaceae bacterium]